MLFHVSCQQAEKGFVKLTGVDYSQSAIDLAQSVAGEKKYSISFAVSGNSWLFQSCSYRWEEQGEWVKQGNSTDISVPQGTYNHCAGYCVSFVIVESISEGIHCQ